MPWVWGWGEEVLDKEATSSSKIKEKRKTGNISCTVLVAALENPEVKGTQVNNP